MLLDPKTRRKLVSPDEAGELLGIDPSNVRHWARRGELTAVVDSPRRVYYYLDQVEKLNKEKAARRRKRGGRPRKGTDAA